VTPLRAAGLVFLLAGGGLYVVARRHLLLRDVRERRGLELRLSLVVSILAFGGFALAHAGMSFSWTGAPALGSLDWLPFPAVFVGLLLLAHLLLRAQRSRADQAVLPVAAFLALLGLLNTYVWETRDANAYVTTVALPAMRAFQTDQRKSVRIQVSIPNELTYEHAHPDGSATVLDDGWLASYNAAAQRFDRLPTVHPVHLNRRLERQLLAVGLGILLVPIVAFGWVRIRLPQKLHAAPGLVGSLAAVALAGASFLSSRDRRLPALLEVHGRSVTIFELLKIVLVVALAALLAQKRAQRRLRDLLALAAVAGTIGAMMWRDTGAGVALLSVSFLMVAMTLGRRGRLTIVLGAAALLALAPAAARTGRAHLPETVRVRLAMWTDPVGFSERASIQNDVTGVLRRLLASSEPPGRAPPERSVQARLHPAPGLVREIESIGHELQWRLDERLRGASRLRPFVPGGSRRDERLLLEAERLWSELGGSAARSPGELAALADRVGAAIGRLRSEAAQIEAGLLARDRRLAARGAVRDRPPPELAAVAPDSFQLQRSLYALRAGGALGVGLGQGRPESIPRLSEDADTAAIGETFGLAGIVLVALFIALLAGRAFEVTRTCRDTTGLLAAGLGGFLGLQALIRLGGVSGLLPFTGLTFPFLGRSGTALVADFLVVALLMAISTRLSAGTSPGRAAPGWFGLAFVVAVVPVGVLQLSGRTLASGHLFATLPGDRSTYLHASDQWSEPSYRTAPGPIVDRSGRVLSRTTALGGARVYPDPQLATELGHTLLQLEVAFRTRLRTPVRGASGSGPALVTTLDSGVERAIADAFDHGALEAGLPDPRTLRGAVVVLDVKTGGLVALESRPTFSLQELADPMAWAAAEASERRSGFPYRYLNRAIHGFYPPGSIFKVVTAAGALERGFHTLHSRDFDYRRGPTAKRPADGADQLGWWHELPLPDGQPITDGNHPQLENWDLSLEEAFAWSCNVAFAQLGQQLGAADLVSFARRFGFERPVVVPGLGSATSTIDNHPERAIGERYVARTSSNLARTAFGQGQVRVTPLQMALVAAAIAHGGTIMQPHVVAGWRSPAGRWLEREHPHPFVDTGLSRLTIADLRELMWTSVTHGWARTARVNAANAHPGVAGKTGSAEWSETQDAAHSWFIGYYPAEAPRVAIAVVVERGGAGPTVAGRIAHDVFASPALARYAQGKRGR
jgi:cell division protein FtsW (lipid II flippase)